MSNTSNWLVQLFYWNEDLQAGISESFDNEAVAKEFAQELENEHPGCRIQLREIGPVEVLQFSVANNMDIKTAEVEIPIKDLPLLDLPSTRWPNYQGNYNDAYEWALWVVKDPKEARAFAEKQEALVNEELQSNRAAERAYAEFEALHGRMPEELQLEVPHRARIGSMGFKAWKEAFDAAKSQNSKTSADQAEVEAAYKRHLAVVKKEWEAAQ